MVVRRPFRGQILVIIQDRWPTLAIFCAVIHIVLGRHQKIIVIVRINRHRNSDLSQVVAAKYAARFFLRHCQPRQQHGREDGYNRQDDQKFDQGESTKQPGQAYFGLPLQHKTAAGGARLQSDSHFSALFGKPERPRSTVQAVSSIAPFPKLQFTLPQVGVHLTHYLPGPDAARTRRSVARSSEGVRETGCSSKGVAPG